MFCLKEVSEKQCLHYRLLLIAGVVDVAGAGDRSITVTLMHPRKSTETLPFLTLFIAHHHQLHFDLYSRKTISYRIAVT